MALDNNKTVGDTIEPEEWNEVATGVNTVNNISDIHDVFNSDDMDGVFNEIGESRFLKGYDRQDPDSMPDLAFNDSSRTLTVSPKSGQASFKFWAKGKNFVKDTVQSIQIPDISGTYAIYFDENGILGYTNINNIPDAAFYVYALTALVRWNSDQQISCLGNEMHGIRMDGATHESHHKSVGATYESGFDINGLASGDTTFTSIDSGIMWDEDIQHELLAETSIPTLYRLGANGDWYTSSSTNEIGHKESGDTYYSYNYWNGTEWTLREGQYDTDYYIVFFAVNPAYNGYGGVRFLSQNAYPNSTVAKLAAKTEIRRMKLDGLPSPELLFLYAMVIKRDGKLQTLDNGSLYVDLRPF